jgi:hypothetical protein
MLSAHAAGSRAQREGGDDLTKPHRDRLYVIGPRDRRFMWEYPGETPSGDQMDFVEVMELSDASESR